MIYLFIGEDELSKQEEIRQVKSRLLTRNLESFNYESYYARELSLSLLKESLSRLPLRDKQRLLVIKDILRLKAAPQEYLLSQIKSLPDNLVIILEMANSPRERNSFLSGLMAYAKIKYFRVKKELNAFHLARAIEKKQAEYALSMLMDLFRAGEKSERILGALRYQFSAWPAGTSRRDRFMRLLLEADLNLKTGRIKPALALELLIIKLCL